MFSSIASQPFVPNKKPNLNAWFDFSDLGYIDVPNGSVSLVENKNIGNGNIDQTVVANRPVSGSDEMNGLNVLSFDGISQFLRNNNYAPQDDLTFFLVFRPIALTATPPNRFSSVLALNGDFQIDGGDENEFRSRFRSEFIGVGTNLQSPTNLLGEDFILTMVLDSDFLLSGIYFNGVLAAQSAYFGSLANLQTLIFGTNRSFTKFLECFISEFVSYDSVFTLAEIQEEVKYLGDKWGITV